MSRIKQRYDDMSRRAFVSWVICFLLVIVVLYYGLKIAASIETIDYVLSPPDLPPYDTSMERDPPRETTQNWSKAQTDWFHHASQGTATLPIPYKWLIALERPAPSPWLMFLGNQGRFMDNEYVLRLGFIKGETSQANPDGLPIGFAQTDSHYFPGLDRKAKAVGFTCAACHTGHLSYAGTEYIIQGGPAMTDLSLLTKSLGAALGQTALSSKLQAFGGKFGLSDRFDRFAARVLENQDNIINRATLKQQLNDTIARLAKNSDAIDVVEGFTRLDALNRIGNQVFSNDLDRHANYSAINAPVNYPHLWTTSWFNWVQYDASIMQPLVRNAGEALGVKAYVNTTAPTDRQRFASSIPYKNLYDIEKLIAGSNPTPQSSSRGLQAPVWPTDFPPINEKKRSKGEQLYTERCQGCHLPPTSSDELWSGKYFKPIEYEVNGDREYTDQNYLSVTVIPLAEIGTDAMQSGVLANRTVDTTGLGLDTEICTNAPSNPAQAGEPVQYGGDNLMTIAFKDSPNANFGLALGAFVQETNDQWMLQNRIPHAWRPIYDGDRPNCLQVNKGYKARPLNGIWATAPFLHNGSIPTLYDLLSPLSERPMLVELGRLEFDPKRVGIAPSDEFIASLSKLKKKEKVPQYKNGYFILDTRKVGNSNKGHQFEEIYLNAGPNPAGVIGPYLSPREREEIIEFLKTL